MGTFFERLGAYIIDFFIVSLILGIIGVGIPDNADNYNEELNKITEQFEKQEITAEEYFDSYYDLFYDMQSGMKLSTFVNVAITIAYFVVFQTLYNGQTLGKKLLKLRVVDKNTKENIGVLRMLVRTLFIWNIVSNVLNLLLVLLFSKSAFLTVYTMATSVEVIFVIIAIIMILYRKDKRGLHDFISGSCVIKEV